MTSTLVLVFVSPRCRGSNIYSAEPLQRPIATKYFAGNLFVALGYEESFQRFGSQIRLQTTFLGPAGTPGKLVHLAGFDSLKPQPNGT